MSAPEAPTFAPSTSARFGQIYRIAVFAFAVIAVVGSLQPFHFHAVPLTAALAKLWDFERIGPVSISDVVANGILFVPLGLFGSAALGSQRAAAVVVVAIGVALSTGLELAQAFVFSRTASIIDIGAETCGTAAGVALWQVLGARIEPAVVSLNEFLTRTTTLDRLVLVYLAGLSGLWLAPFDFTIRPSELVEKYERLHMLLPFSPSPDAATATELGLMAAVAIPVGMAGVVVASWWRTRASVMSGLVAGICWMAMLTCAQVFVASRTTDSTLVVAALPGLALGAVAGARISRAPAAPR